MFIKPKMRYLSISHIISYYIYIFNSYSIVFEAIPAGVSKKCLNWVINKSVDDVHPTNHLVPAFSPRTSFLLEDFGMHELRVATGDGDQMVERCWFMVSYSDCHLVALDLARLTMVELVCLNHVRYQSLKC